jgi:nicotinamide phosphoribosyltransferase
MEDIDFAEEIWTEHGEPFDRAMWEHIVKVHNGYMPVEIKAIPEGTVIPVHNVMVTIENTDPICFPLTTFLETALLRAIWYPVTVATTSREIKKVIAKYLMETGDISLLPFKLHDFGARGASSKETAKIGGMAHLVNFMGTDTIGAIIGHRKYYHTRMAGFSIPAAEHSTITSWGRENEAKAYRNMLRNFAKPGSIVAVVSDSYDIFNAVENLWGGELKQEVIDSGATLVIRPDSGDPVEVVTKVAKLLDSKFGSTINDKGYKVLNVVRIIQGDGINIDTVGAILESLKLNGFSADNVAFGMGGALLQAAQRDDQKFAMKCSAALIDGQWVDVYKDPITDKGKTSKKGRLALIDNTNSVELTESGVIKGPSVVTVSEDYAVNFGATDLLRSVYRNGVLMVDENLETIRERAKL